MIKGADISKWQDDNTTARRPDFKKLKAAGCEFVFIRAAYGLSVDEDFAYNWQAAKEAGLLRGAYQWLVWTVPPLTQADKFLSMLASDPGELPPVVDYEDRYAMPSPGTMRLALRDYLLRVEQKTGRKPIIYTGPDYWKNYGSGDSYWKSYPLWIANYATTTPMTPPPWGMNGWTFWQWTAKGDGLAHGMESLNIDLDWYNGTLDGLYALAGTNTPPPPPPEPVIEQWYMPVPVPGVGIPAITQTSQVKDMSKRDAILLGEYEQVILSSLQPSKDVWGWYIHPNACPTKGINSNGKLIHNRIVYAGNPIRVTESGLGWGWVRGVDETNLASLKLYPVYNQPDRIARLWQVEANGKLNIPSRLASLARLPIFSGWIEMSRLTRVIFPRSVRVTSALNIRATPDKSQAPIGGFTAGAVTDIESLHTGQGGWWGKLLGRPGYICLRWADASNPRGTNYTDWLV